MNNTAGDELTLRAKDQHCGRGINIAGQGSTLRAKDQRCGRGINIAGQKITQVVTIEQNNYIVWQHQTKQLHCMTTPNKTITLCDNTKPNNYIVWQHVRTWYYDKRILPKIMCSQQEEKVVSGGWWKVVSGKSCVTPGQTKIAQVVTIKPNN